MWPMGAVPGWVSTRPQLGDHARAAGGTPTVTRQLVMTGRNLPPPAWAGAAQQLVAASLRIRRARLQAAAGALISISDLIKPGANNSTPVWRMAYGPFRCSARSA
jgi:hypothetical protein